MRVRPSHLNTHTLSSSRLVMLSTSMRTVNAHGGASHEHSMRQLHANGCRSAGAWKAGDWMTPEERRST